MFILTKCSRGYIIKSLILVLNVSIMLFWSLCKFNMIQLSILLWISECILLFYGLKLIIVLKPLSEFDCVKLSVLLVFVKNLEKMNNIFLIFITFIKLLLLRLINIIP